MEKIEIVKNLLHYDYLFLNHKDLINDDLIAIKKKYSFTDASKKIIKSARSQGIALNLGLLDVREKLKQGPVMQATTGINTVARRSWKLSKAALDIIATLPRGKAPNLVRRYLEGLSCLEIIPEIYAMRTTGLLGTTRIDGKFLNPTRKTKSFVVSLTATAFRYLERLPGEVSQTGLIEDFFVVYLPELDLETLDLPAQDMIKEIAKLPSFKASNLVLGDK